MGDSRGLDVLDLESIESAADCLGDQGWDAMYRQRQEYLHSSIPVELLQHQVSPPLVVLRITGRRETG